MSISRLGLTAKEYYRLTPRELDEAFRDNRETREQNIKKDYEVARYLAMHIWNSQQRYWKDEQWDPARAFPFTWDKEKEPRIQSVEEQKEILEGLSCLYAIKKRK